MAAHRYWRVFGVTTNGDYMGAANLQFRTTAGVSDQPSGGTAIASGELAYDYAKELAFDGSDTSAWVAPSTAQNTHWIGYDFGAGNEREVQQVALKARTVYTAQTPNSARIEWSDDGVEWMLHFAAAFGTFDSGENKVLTHPDFAPPEDTSHPYRYWRVRFDAHRGGGYAGYNTTILKSCDMRAVLDGPNLAVDPVSAFGSPAMAGESEGVRKAFDGSSDSFWQGASTWTNADRFAGLTREDHHIIGYDFGPGVQKSIVQIGLLWWNDYYDRGATHGVVEASNDGTTWDYQWEIFVGDDQRLSNVKQIYTRPQVTEETATRWAFIADRGSTIDNRQGVHLAVASIYMGSFGYVGPQNTFGSQALDGYPWSNVNDGNLSTFGHSNIQQSAYVGVEFSSAPGRPISVNVYPRQDGYGYQLPVVWGLGYVGDDTKSVVRVSGGVEAETFTTDNIYAPKQYVAAPPVFEEPTVAEYTGDWETFTAQESGLLLTKLWGGGGHGGQYGGGNYGGGGGYVYAELIVDAGDVVAVQVAGGGRNRSPDDEDNRGTGGWPDGGTGSYGDTWGGGGGGSSRVWINGVLALVAGGGGGAAGYSGKGGGGGGYGSADNSGNNNFNLTPYYGTGGAGTVDGPYLPKNFPGYGGSNYGWKIGRGIPDVGALGRTGGHGGDLRTGTGDDGGGGGGGYYGGGGGGGDGCSAGGGASYINPSFVSYAYQTNASSFLPGRADDDDYPGAPTARGQASNTQDPAGDGLAVFAGVEITPGGAAPDQPWRDAIDRPPENQSDNYQGYTLRCRIGADQFLVDGNTVRLGFRGLDTHGLRIDELWVGPGNDPAFSWGCQFVDTPQQVSWNDGAVTAIDLEPGEQIWSDPIEFAAGTDNLLVSAYFDNSGAAYVGRSYSSGNDKWIGYSGDPTKVVPIQNVWAFWSPTYNPATMEAPGTGSFTYGSQDPWHFLDGVQVAAIETGPIYAETIGTAAAASAANGAAAYLGNGNADGHASAAASANAVGVAVLPGDMVGSASAHAYADAESYIPGVARGIASGTGTAIGVVQARYGIVGTATATGAGSGNGFVVTRRPTVGTASGTGLALGSLQTLGPNPGAGQASGLGTATGAITVIAARAGTATATSTADATVLALGTIEAVGTAAGMASTSSYAFASGVLGVVGNVIDAVATGLGVGSAIYPTAGEATAAASADAAGSYVPTPMVGRADGTSTATGFIERFAITVGRARGDGEAKGISVGFFGAVGFSSTTSAGYGVPDTARGAVGSATATSTAAAAATGLAPTVGTAAATLTADGVAAALAPARGVATATSNALGVNSTLAPTVGSAGASSAAQGRAQAPTSAVGSATATSAAGATARRFLAAVGTAGGATTVSGIASARFGAVGRAAATSLAAANSNALDPGVDTDDMLEVGADDWLILVPLIEYELVVVAADDAIVVVPEEGSAAVAA